MRFGAVLCGLLLANALVASADDPRFIGDLEASADRWKAMEGLAIEVEGRVSTVSRGEMRFQGSRLNVILPEDARPRGGSTYKVRGDMRPADGKTVFVARSIETYPSDLERLNVAEAKLKPNVSEGWLELADEFLQRAKFYKDDELKARATEVVDQGLKAAVAEASDDIAKLNEAAQLALDRGSEDVAALARHRVVRLQWSAIADRLDTDTDQAIVDANLLLDRLGRDLPGATEPMTEQREALVAAYGRDPFDAYSRVDAEQRRMIARILFAEILEATLAKRLLPNGSNADDIADELARRLPDRPDLEAAYREKAVASTMESIGNLAEADLLAFKKRLEEAGDAKRGAAALDAWLKSRLEAARKRGPTFIFNVGKDYERLKNDEETAVALFQESLEVDSRLIEAVKAMESHGYEKVGGKWRKKMAKKAAALPEDVKLGEVREGMTDDQVRSSLRSAPDSVARIASFGLVTEVWIYRDFKRVVTLRRRSIDGEARVVEVGELD